MKKILLFSLFSLLSIQLWAFDFFDNGIYYSIDKSSDTPVCYVTYNSNIKYTGDISIPDKVTYNSIEYAVTSIGYKAFYQNTGLTSISLPTSITEIGQYAFQGCTGLTSISLPYGVAKIRYQAFNNCTELTSADLGTNLKNIETGAFSGCSKLSTVKVPNTLTDVGEDAFGYCNLSAPLYTSTLFIRLPETFEGSYTVPSGITKIASGAFKNCSSLTSVNCSATSIVELGTGVFRSSKIESLSISDNVTVLPEGTCYGCTKLQEIYLPKKLETVGSDCFSYCTSLASITFFSTVLNNIESLAFNSCSKLANIYLWVTTPPTVASDAFTTYGNLHVLDGYKSVYSSDDTWNKFTIVDDTDISMSGKCGANATYKLKTDKILTISGSGAMYDYPTYQNAPWYGQNIKKIVIADGITSVGKYAFWGSNETSIEFANSLTIIDNYAFASNAYLSSVKFNSGLITLGKSAFINCSGLTEIEIPSSVTTISEGAFQNCDKLADVINRATTPQEITSTTFSKYGNLTVPESSLDAYRSADYWKNFTFSQIKYVTSLSLDKSSLTLEVGQSGTLVVAITPDAATDKTVEWSSSNSSIVTVDQEGKVTAIGRGSATITALAKDGSNQSASCVVTVNKCIDIIECSSPFENSTSTYYDAIRYTRNFNNTKWQALYIPFSMNYNDWSENFEVAAINNFHSYDLDNDGINETWQLEIEKINSGSLLPNHPYMIKALTTGEQTITISNATLYKTEVNSIDCSSVSTKYTFTGTYSQVTGLKTNGYYFMSGGNLCSATDDNVTLNPFRWYMTMEDRGSQTTNSAKPSVIKVIVWGEEDDETTDISNINNVDMTKSIYDISGRKINSEKLQKGLYIINGKKTVIK